MKTFIRKYMKPFNEAQTRFTLTYVNHVERGSHLVSCKDNETGNYCYFRLPGHHMRTEDILRLINHRFAKLQEGV